MAVKTTAIDKTVPFREAACPWTERGNVMKRFLSAVTIIIACGLVAMAPSRSRANDTFNFKLFVSSVAGTCLSEANGQVTLNSLGIVEEMHIQVNGLPPTTDFAVFVIQSPVAPFGLAWYEGDLLTDAGGSGVTDLIGRFSRGTFIVAPGSTSAPVVFKGPFPDASSNPPTAPVQLYHVGIWFNSAQDAQKNGCPSNVTPFNSEHQAGIQVLNSASKQFTKIGPLGHFNPH
jgi:hypothetical protein